MKRIFTVLVIMALGFSACKKEDNNSNAGNLPAGVHAVKVLESMNVANYTYLHVSEGNSDYWMAAPQIETQKGQTLYYSQGMEMKNFHSEALNKTFSSILFVQSISPNLQQDQSLTSVHQQAGTTQKEDVSVQPLPGGKTIAQIYLQRNELSGKTIRVKGKVVKYNSGIMSRNWIHIQDGTESNGSYDLLITSKDETSPGETIVAEGKIVLNKDFGAGYSYSVLLEDAKIISGKHI